MGSLIRSITLGVISFYLAGCATPTTQSTRLDAQLTQAEIRYQQQLKLKRVMEYQTRIERLGNPLLQAALPFCQGDQSTYLGARVDNISAWPEEYRSLAKETLKLDEALQVTHVLPGSPAEQGGLRTGDILLKVNQKRTLGGIGAIDDYRQLLQEAGSGRVAFQVLRDKKPLTLELEPQPICNYQLHVVMNNAINAYADGSNIIITSGLIRFSQNDREISMVLAHEIAHNAMKHIEAKKANMSTASVLDILVAAYGINTHGLFASLGAQSFSREFEQEADYVGLYILARSGGSLEDLEAFWQRAAAETPDANQSSLFRSHPISAKRTLAIRQTAAEIAAKRANGDELLPNSK